MVQPMLIAKNNDIESVMLPKMANRHGLIAGATGTGKTVTLQSLAEQFSRIGVPVFMADVKGDLSGMSQVGGGNAKVEARVQQLALTGYANKAYPVMFWDMFGEKGHPVRTTLSEMGPLLLARMLNLNEVQGGVLNAIFKIADDNGMLLLDLKDLRAMAQHCAENAATYQTQYGNISTASVGAIQRALLQLETEGGDVLFGEPALNLEDMMQTDGKGLGFINILAADKLLNSPRVYATLLLWLLSELFEKLPEVGDLDKPKLVFFFDEAHLLFNDAPTILMQKIEQVVRLVRSKGVGVYFVSQNPLDIPDVVLGQLGNRVQHALRAFTPRDQKAVQVAAQTFRANPKLDVATAITELGVGEALVSFLDEKGAPTPVERVFVCPPESRIGPATDVERKQVMAQSLVVGVYDKLVDRESAYEILKQRAEQASAATQAQQQEESSGFDLGGILGGKTSRSDSVLESAAKSAARAIGSQLGRAIIRGVLGSIMGNGKSKR
ncbi:helicase HerA-like domain-containing protein [Methylophilus glucosoxydans]|uniref:Helicase HerA-like domain-containing protein n=1 Tax=Methylophilus glucosoxydans TaxID=752553 RepID=A0ABW3GHJ4_9PROT|nr:helicase HerA-like domain-containing protein [Methylophilus sp. VKM B-3414]MDT7850256.1 helicase HerA-like domain-containing protein [Methylophilus sp. VKM B-3414]